MRRVREREREREGKRGRNYHPVQSEMLQSARDDTSCLADSRNVAS